MREQTDERRVLEQVAGRLHPAAEDVDRVRHRVEGVEGDADRQHDVERRQRRPEPDCLANPVERAEEEAGVLEVAEDADVRRQRGGQQQPPAGLDVRS
jgi:hypothetical protein